MHSHEGEDENLREAARSQARNKLVRAAGRCKGSFLRTHYPLRKTPEISPIFKADKVMLHVSGEKDGKSSLVYARIGRCRPAWRGACAAVPRRYVLHQVKRGASIILEPPALA